MWRLPSAEVQRRGLPLCCCGSGIVGCARGLSECSVRRPLCAAAEELPTGVAWDATWLSAAGGLRDRRSLADTVRPAAASSGGGCEGRPEARGFISRPMSRLLGRCTPGGGTICCTSMLQGRRPPRGGGVDCTGGACVPGSAAPSRDLLLRPRTRVLARQMLLGTASSPDGFLTEGGLGGSCTPSTASRYDPSPPAVSEVRHKITCTAHRNCVSLPSENARMM